MTFSLKISSLEESFYNANSLELNIPTIKGEIGILKDHIHFLTQTLEGKAIVLDASSKKHIIDLPYQGFLHFKDNLCWVWLFP